MIVWLYLLLKNGASIFRKTRSHMIIEICTDHSCLKTLAGNRASSTLYDFSFAFPSSFFFLLSTCKLLCVHHSRLYWAAGPFLFLRLVFITSLQGCVSFFPLSSWQLFLIYSILFCLSFFSFIFFFNLCRNNALLHQPRRSNLSRQAASQCPFLKKSQFSWAYCVVFICIG